MAFDGIFMSAIAHDLSSKLIGGRIDRIYQPEREEIHLLIRNAGQKYRLLISANAQMARVHLTEANKENPTTPPMFCMVLRKHLEGGKIIGINQPGLERILQIVVKGYDELGQVSEKVLIVEVMGKHSNIILIDPETQLILDGVKRYTHAVSRYREILPGREYLVPPSQGKMDIRHLTAEDFTQALFQGKLEAKVQKLCLNILDGFSPLLCREIIARADLTEDITLNHCGDYEVTRLWQAVSEIKSTVQSGDYQPTLIRSLEGTVVDYAPITLQQYYAWSTETSGINQVVDTFYQEKYTQNKFQQIQRDILKQIEEHIQRIEKKLEIQLDNLAASEAAEDLRVFGELLTANLHLVSRGQTKVSVVNYYDPEGQALVIELEPHLSPAENAQMYFKKYAKIKSGGKMARGYIEEFKQELAYLYSVANNLEQSATLKDLEEIRQELVQEGYLKAKILRGQKKGSQPASQPSQPLNFTSSDGFTILVGKNNRQNDRLTLREANPEDLWLHTKDIPGSHVIIRTNNQELPDRTLEEAAQLAAFFSKARAADKVPVDYTYKKYVHKPKGAKPGMVIYENQHTIMVKPAPKDGQLAT